MNLLHLARISVTNVVTSYEVLDFHTFCHYFWNLNDKKKIGFKRKCEMFFIIPPFVNQFKKTNLIMKKNEIISKKLILIIINNIIISN